MGYMRSCLRKKKHNLTQERRSTFMFAGCLKAVPVVVGVGLVCKVEMASATVRGPVRPGTAPEVHQPVGSSPRAQGAGDMRNCMVCVLMDWFNDMPLSAFA